MAESNNDMFIWSSKKPRTSIKTVLRKTEQKPGFTTWHCLKLQCQSGLCQFDKWIKEETKEDIGSSINQYRKLTWPIDQWEKYEWGEMFKC